MKLLQKMAAVAALCVVSMTGFAAGVVNLGKGDAQSFYIKSEIGTVFVSSPEIADYQVVDKHRVVVFGKDLGQSSFMVFDINGRTLLSRKLVVNNSFTEIEDYVSLKYPEASVSVQSIAGKVVLTGSVKTEEARDGIYEMVGALLSKGAAKEKNLGWKTDNGTLDIDFMTKYDYADIVNHIEVTATKQVNVKLTVAEVNQSLLEKLGIRYGGASSEPGMFATMLNNSITSSDIFAVINALSDDNVGQILAEPNLSVISGESAEFNVGGELPFMTIVNDTPTITYIEYGIGLGLMAKVERDDKIRLSMTPTVSSPDLAMSEQATGVPALRSRKARTTVELADGQSFVLAGLLSTEDRERLSKVPLLGDIPGLGALFRYSETERNKTELIIVATVNLVEPVKANQIQLPRMKRTNHFARWFGIDFSDDQPSDGYAERILASGGFKK